MEDIRHFRLRAKERAVVPPERAAEAPAGPGQPRSSLNILNELGFLDD